MNTDILMRIVFLVSLLLVIKWLMLRAENKKFSTFKGYLRLFTDSLKIILKYKWLFIAVFFIALPAEIYDNLLKTIVGTKYKPGVEDFFNFNFSLNWELFKRIQTIYSSFREIVVINPLPATRFNFLSIALLVIIFFLLLRKKFDTIGKVNPKYSIYKNIFYISLVISLFTVVYYLSPFYYKYLLGNPEFDFKYWLIYILPSSYLTLISAVVFSAILIVAAKSYFLKIETIARDYIVVIINNFGRLFVFFLFIFIISILYSLFQKGFLYVRMETTGIYIFNFLYSILIMLFMFTPFFIIDDNHSVLDSMDLSIRFILKNIPELLVFLIFSFIAIFLVNILSFIFDFEGKGLWFSTAQNLFSLIIIFLETIVKVMYGVGITLLFISLKYQKKK